MNAQQVKDHLTQGGQVNRFTKLNAGGRKWVANAFDAGLLCRRSDCHANWRWVYTMAVN